LGLAVLELPRLSTPLLSRGTLVQVVGVVPALLATAVVKVVIPTTILAGVQVVTRAALACLAAQVLLVLLPARPGTQVLAAAVVVAGGAQAVVVAQAAAVAA
jgi:hypothetical protein